MSSHRQGSRTVVVGLLATTIGLTGCSIPDVSMSPGIVAPEPSAAASAAPTMQPVDVAPTPVRPPGELDPGTATHILSAGDRTVVIDYWTTEAAAEWTAGDTKAIQVSAHLEDDDSEQAVLVTRFVATADDGVSRTVVVEDRGEFALTPPFSYGSVLGVPPSADDTDSLTLFVQLELLVETEPESDSYFRQTVLDTLVLPLLPEVRN